MSADPEIIDLVRVIRDDQLTANLVFGNNAPSPLPTPHGYTYDDGADTILLSTVDRRQCTETEAIRDGTYSLWDIQTEGPVSVGQVLYIRVRFVVRKTARAWHWRKIGLRRSFVLADLRVNELRAKPQLPNAPDFVTQSKSFKVVNCFLVASSRLKSGRVSPQPTYVRLLEGILWERYLGRRLGRKGDVFVITYWQKDDVSHELPFRAFMELERRRPTAGRFAVIAAGISILGYLLFSPSGQLDQSTIFALWQSGYVKLVALSVAAFAILPKFLPQLSRVFMMSSWLRDSIRRFETWVYKLRS